MNLSQLINILQTILTVAMTVIPTILLALGCTQNATGTLDCSQATVSPSTLAWIVGAIGFVKTVVLPWLAPGGWIRNLFGERAVVAPSTSSAATTGTVAPQDVR
jgi:hypothetical protein